MIACWNKCAGKCTKPWHSSHKQPDHSPRKNQLHVFHYLLFMLFPDNHQHGKETYAKEDRVYTKAKGDSFGEFSLGKWNDPFWSLARLWMLPCGKWDELGGTGERRRSRRLFTKIGINWNDLQNVDRCEKHKGGNVVRNFHDWIWKEKEEDIKGHS